VILAFYDFSITAQQTREVQLLIFYSLVDGGLIPMMSCEEYAGVGNVGESTL